MRDEFAPIVPIEMPLAGFALAIGTLLIVTVLGMKGTRWNDICKRYISSRDIPVIC